MHNQRAFLMMQSFSFFVGLAVATAANAQAFESSTAIDQAVERSLGQRVGMQGGAAYPVDPRLRLARCPSALVVEQVDPGAVEVRCSAIGWRLRVPIAGATRGGTPPVEAIKRGDTVKIAVRGSGFEISTSGVALENAAVGSGVRVKLVTDGSVFRATVIESGFVEMRD
jgi:flagellar basal body P-ring formation protein FlgA